MSYEKTKFDKKSIPSELTVDNGNSYQTKDVLRGDYKSPEEREAVRKKKELDNNVPYGGAKKQD